MKRPPYKLNRIPGKLSEHLNALDLKHLIAARMQLGGSIKPGMLYYNTHDEPRIVINETDDIPIDRTFITNASAKWDALDEEQKKEVEWNAWWDIGESPGWDRLNPRTKLFTIDGKIAQGHLTAKKRRQTRTHPPTGTTR